MTTRRKPKSPKLPPRETALARAEQGREIAACIRDAIHAELPADAETLTALQHRIRLCNDPNNLWFGSDLHTDDGELYNAAGRLWTCNSKLCPDCVAKQSRRNRKSVRRALAALPLESGQYRQMLTFTFPKTKLPLLQARSIMDYAWSLFRKRSWFKNTILGGAKSEEFTVDQHGYHYHMHALCITKYVLFSTFRHHWTECVIKSFAKHGQPLTIETSDDMVVAHCDKISNIDDAVKEVAKYITKGSSWKAIRQSDLLDIARIKRFPRMFELFGTFRVALKEPALVDAEEPVVKDYLDTGYVSDGQPDPSWRETLPQIGASAYLTRLHYEFGEAIKLRRDQLLKAYPYAKFTRPKPQPKPTIDDAMQLIAKVKRARFGIADHQPGKVLHGFGRSIDIKAIAALDPDRFA